MENSKKNPKNEKRNIKKTRSFLSFNNLPSQKHQQIDKTNIQEGTLQAPLSNQFNLRMEEYGNLWGQYVYFDDHRIPYGFFPAAKVLQAKNPKGGFLESIPENNREYNDLSPTSITVTRDEDLACSDDECQFTMDP